jgi:hypothetical protein
MVAVPADTPVTTPDVFTVATRLLLLDQMPPAKPLEVNVEVAPVLIVVVPERVPALGKALMMTVEEVLELQPLEVTE